MFTADTPGMVCIRSLMRVLAMSDTSRMDLESLATLTKTIGSESASALVTMGGSTSTGRFR